MTQSWVRWQSADPWGDAWARKRVTNTADPREIAQAIDAMPLGRPTFPAGGPVEKWYACVTDDQAEKALSGEGFDMYAQWGWGIPVCKRRGVQIIPGATRELEIEMPSGVLQHARAFFHYADTFVLAPAEVVFAPNVTVREARPIATGEK